MAIVYYASHLEPDTYGDEGEPEQDLCEECARPMDEVGRPTVSTIFTATCRECYEGSAIPVAGPLTVQRAGEGIAIYDANRNTIARIGMSYRGLGIEDEANARLFAAAPDLLAALQDYMSQFGQALDAHGIPYGPAQKEADVKARAAIAKARGL